MNAPARKFTETAPEGITESALESEHANQFVTFTSGPNAYGIDIMSVREIRSWTPTTELPGQAFGARGVLDIRGHVIEVFDLSAMLGGPATEAMPGQVVLVVAMADHDIGILVDTVSDIIYAGPEDFRTPPNKGGKISAMVKQEDKLVSILDLTSLFPGSF